MFISTHLSGDLFQHIFELYEQLWNSYCNAVASEPLAPLHLLHFWAVHIC